MQKGWEHLWVVVLETGESSRSEPETSSAEPPIVPKPFRSLDGRRTIFGRALERAARIVPRRRLVAAVLECHRRWWRGELTGLPSENVVVLPRDRGTGTAILSAFLSIFFRFDSEARILVLPSEQYVGDEKVLRQALEEACEAADGLESRGVLLGIQPENIDANHEWILSCSSVESGAREVISVIEKPWCVEPADLKEAGGLWNSFMFVANVTAMFRLFETSVPWLMQAMLPVARQGGGLQPEALRALYSSLPATDFSRDILQVSPELFSVVPVPPCGWIDLGSPSRVNRFLDRLRSAIDRRNGAAEAASGSAQMDPRDDRGRRRALETGAATRAMGGRSRSAFLPEARPMRADLGGQKPAP